MIVRYTCTQCRLVTRVQEGDDHIACACGAPYEVEPEPEPVVEPTP